MRLSVVDACFPIGSPAKGVAAIWIEWFCKKKGALITSIGDSEVVAVTCVDPRNWGVCYTIKKKYRHVKIVSGGAGAFSPYSLSLHSDAVCVGDGQRFLSTLCTDGLDAVKVLPESFIHGQNREVIPAEGFPFDCPPIQAEDGSFKIWLGRGCKKKCAFCQTGLAQQYQENPKPENIIKNIKMLKGKKNKFSYMSNDLMQHSFWKLLPPVEHGSYSLDFIKKNGLPPARQIRLGIEGVSEKLRKFINKPISKDDLVKATAWLNQNGKSVRWFMIAGLPTEKKHDWDELKEAVLMWKKICHKGVLALSFTAWQPEPATPLGAFPIDDFYWENWKDFKEWFFSGVGWSNRIKLMNPAMPSTRLESAMARMGTSEDILRKGGDWGPNDRVLYPNKNARNKFYDYLIKKEATSNG